MDGPAASERPTGWACTSEPRRLRPDTDKPPWARRHRPHPAGDLVLAALATALAVSQAGSIGFIGLVIPHLIRRCWASFEPRVSAATVRYLRWQACWMRDDTLARTCSLRKQLRSWW
ncbi:iron chelate uptake ABC transporter family permease subunit [Thiohalobacter thiocyanaticus]|uniref:Uncharacterized protein n=1 Tax=Thiohalobacter thiocyanaticus TaxID=585455 RepID=A0A426QKY2_9GAMM|nr:iron chelate uptake ABC transporter family permease subunit [Thiohalobacter thiocyanaticus]RRQ22418.1 hypothetical protein D6C00_10990 [Thiohalobacter thiocyanaticus]